MKKAASLLRGALSALRPGTKLSRVVYPLVAALLAVAFILTGALDRLDRWTQDRLFQRESTTDKDIVLIGIDERTLEELGPFPTGYRMHVADALMVLADDPDKLPAAVAVDVLYAGNTDEASDAYLAAAAARLRRMVSASQATFGRETVWENGRPAGVNDASVILYETPYEELEKNVTVGHINAMYDSDGVMRHALLYVTLKDGQKVYSMPYETARKYLSAKGRTIQKPPTQSGWFYIPYTAKSGAYSDSVSLVDVIEGRVQPDYWAGKIVLIGPYAEGLQDAYSTPIDRAEHMYGVEIQANIIQCLLENNFKSEPAQGLQLLLLLSLCIVIAFLYQKLNVLWGALLCTGVTALGFLGAQGLYLLGYIAHPLWLGGCAILLFLVFAALKYAAAIREKRLLALENERIKTELALATRIQASALPKDFPPFPDRDEFDIYATMQPAKEVGGDLYDYFLIDEDHLALVIGDVAGKGVPAALFMMVAMALIRHVVMGEKDPAKALMAVNEAICARNPEEMFVTVWLGVLEISSGILTCTNAGHEYPALRQPNGRFELIKDKHGLVLGGMEGARYKSYEIRLEPGATLFVYTDGVPEATDSAETLFGNDRLTQALRARENGSPEETVAAVKQATEAFTGDAPQFDDMTMMCLFYRGVQSATEDQNRIRLDKWI